MNLNKEEKQNNKLRVYSHGVIHMGCKFTVVNVIMFLRCKERTCQGAATLLDISTGYQYRIAGKHQL